MSGVTELQTHHDRRTVQSNPKVLLWTVASSNDVHPHVLYVMCLADVNHLCGYAQQSDSSADAACNVSALWIVHVMYQLCKHKPDSGCCNPYRGEDWKTHQER